LFCDGYEDRGASSAGVLAIGDVANVSPALNLARMAKRLAEKVVIYTNGATELMDQIVAALGSDPVITFDNRRVVRLEKVDEDRSETIVYFDDGSSVSQGFLVSVSIAIPLFFRLPASRGLTSFIGPQAKDRGQRPVCETALVGDD
jgi:hypothetical protein